MDPKQLLDAIEAYAEESQLAPSTVCLRALGSGVRYRTLQTEAEKLAREHAAFLRYAQAVPAATARKKRWAPR
ncbi:hypothetical protein [Haematobacter massiliensis]|uniref:hypothetical protein n=1 Tax=Haematobacter massiliensis TaxID=195105 RepID=UPI0023F58889|nr:hypothetical protein [Haematobacter massiliensis]